MKRGTTVCAHGTPTDQECLLCLQDMECPTLQKKAEVVEASTVGESKCLRCRHSLARIKCEVVDISPRISAAFSQCPGCKVKLFMVVDAVESKVYCHDLDEIYGNIKV